MKKIVINENQRGFLFKDGKYVKTLGAGKYFLPAGRSVELSTLGQSIHSKCCTIDTLLADPDFAAQTVTAEVADQQMVLHFVNGNFANALTMPGKTVFWKGGDLHEFRVVDLSAPEVGEYFPRYLFNSLSPMLYSKVQVADYQKARLYFDNRFVRLLEPGTYYFWKTNTKVDIQPVDTRLTQMNITGQEIMTRDKVALRITFVCTYRITDYVKVGTEVDDFAEQLHVAAQLALRNFVGKYKLDEILESKEELSRYVFEALKEKQAELFVEVKSAGVKDIILPGEVRDIMNTVLVAEKRAQANVITRREEVASTRSLLNTAKLMEENQTLYQLKQLECVERICENVGNINLNGNGDMLSQLLGMLGSPKAG